MLADGSEYTGAYVAEVSIAELRAFHRPRMELLAEAGADVLACETVPAAAEAEALIAEAEALGVPVWLSLTTVVDDDGVVRTRRGEPAADVFAMTDGVDAVIAVGVNCTAPAGDRAVGRRGGRRRASRSWSTRTAARAGTPSDRRWTGTPGIATDDVPGWVDAGARLIGGCCRVRPEHIAAIASVIRSPDR